MFGFFKSKNERIYDEIRSFENRLNQSIVPFLDRPEKPILANGAVIAMATNIAFYFVAARSITTFTECSKPIISNITSTFGAVINASSKGKINDTDAALSLLKEMARTRDGYFTALDKSATEPEQALQECLDILSESAGGWTFQGEVERAMAVIKLSQEIGALMQKFRSII